MWDRRTARGLTKMSPRAVAILWKERQDTNDPP
nr:MAG TPA: hypothetical protein [Caudoviricetes sp.]DAX42271.1 MAG TPA: hypothetical protein [Caudoviricetes sp.]